MPILEMVKDNKFRQDLLYRINTIEIQIPPLRDRLDDIPLLAHHFLNLYDRKYQKNVRTISEAAMRILQRYNWPGNVRELQHAIERAVIMCNSQVLNPEDFYFNTNPSRTEESQVTLEDYHLEEVEKILIRKVLKKYDGNITQAANELGLTRSSLYRRLEKYGL
jgi:transcriptional regulator with PAS, ATPase and Fis domain